MKKIYKSIILLSLFLLTACGYTPLYIAKKENFYISEIQSNNKNNYYYYFKNHLKSYMQSDQVNKKNLKIEIDLSKNKKTISKLTPENRFYLVTKIITTEASIHTNLFRDLYIVLGDGNLNDGWVVKIYLNPLVAWIWIGSFVTFIGGLTSVNLNYKKLKKS